LINSQFEVENTETTWSHYGEYSGFLLNLMKAKNEIGKDKNDKVYYDKMVEFMALYDK